MMLFRSPGVVSNRLPPSLPVSDLGKEGWATGPKEPISVPRRKQQRNCSIACESKMVAGGGSQEARVDNS